MPSGFRRFEFNQAVFKKEHQLKLNMIFHDSNKKAEFKKPNDSEVLSVFFQALEPLQPQ